jgi:hypothetical protein
LPWSREEEKLASSKLGAFSKPAGQNLYGMMHEVNVRHNDKEGRSNMAHAVR